MRGGATRCNPYKPASSLSSQTAEQKNAQHDEKNIREPDEQLRMGMWVSTQCIANDHKKKIRRGDDQGHGKSDGSLAAVRGHTERYTDDREGDTRERK